MILSFFLFFFWGGGRGVKNHSKNPYDLKQQIAFHQIRYFGAQTSLNNSWNFLKNQVRAMYIHFSLPCVTKTQQCMLSHLSLQMHLAPINVIPKGGGTWAKVGKGNFGQTSRF